MHHQQRQLLTLTSKWNKCTFSPVQQTYLYLMVGQDDYSASSPIKRLDFQDLNKQIPYIQWFSVASTGYQDLHGYFLSTV